MVNVDGYKWFGKPRIDQNSRRGEGGVGFLVRECIAEGTRWKRERSFVLMLCVYAN